MADIPTPTIPELSNLTKAVERPENLASGSQEIQNAALGAAKYIFDLSLKTEEKSSQHVNDFIASIQPSLARQTRSQAANASRQSASRKAPSQFTPTPLTSLFTENLDEDQIWAQLDIRTKNICEVLHSLLGPPEDGGEAGEEDEFKQALEDEGVSFSDEEDSEEYSEDDDEESEEESDEDEEDPDMFGLSEDEDEAEEQEEEEEVMDLEQQLSGDDNESEDSGEDEVPSRLRKRKKGPASELDDGFFDLAKFKAEIEKAEAKSSSRGHLAEEDESDEEFDDIDLFAPVEGDDVEEEDDSKALMYNDFFSAPRNVAPVGKNGKATSKPSAIDTSKAPANADSDSRGVRFHEEVRVKKIKRSGKGRSLNDSDEEEDEEDGFGEAFGEDAESESDSEVGEDEEDESDSDAAESDSEDDSVGDDTHGRETIERLKDDLLADDDEEDEQKDMTTHQKRMAALKAQIEELEHENVSQKHWTLMGEADTRSRPQNSLLEEDLEFERTMKPTPVITEEAVQSLEQLIKARILENNFDDVVRLRAVDDKPFLPSRLLELKDTQSQQSLAQIYEGEYMAAQAGGSLPDDRDGKLAKEHEEIEAQWDKICSKLDALSNAHFVPKLPKSLISTVSNVSTATMESALPTSKSAASMLAPEEVFAAATSQPRARSELTPEEKRSLRTKERKAKRKQRDLLDKTVDKVAKMRNGSVKKQKQAALDSIVKHGKGVTVVGKAAKDLKSRGKSAKKS